MSNMKQWFSESLHHGYQQRFEIEHLVYEGQSPYQTITLFDHGYYGRVLALDGIIQTTTHDEFIYHEMLAHVPIFAHGNVKRVMIIGGGDGGLLREVLKHQSVEHVTMIELDPTVVELCKEWMPQLSNGSFDDPRCHLYFEDGQQYLQNTSETFDLILVDSSDPIGPQYSTLRSSFLCFMSKSIR